MNLIPFIIILIFFLFMDGYNKQIFTVRNIRYKKDTKIDTMKDSVKCLLKYWLKVLFGLSIVCYLHYCLD